jgi:hypothetical protein
MGMHPYMNWYKADIEKKAFFKDTVAGDKPYNIQ